MRQHEIVTRHPLLNEKGELIEIGWAKSLILDYDRNAIKASKHRIKEWDYYLITCDEFALALTIDDNSYMGLDSISLLNFSEKWEHTFSPMKFMTWGKRKMPSSSKEGNIEVFEKDYSISFKKTKDKRLLLFHMDNFFEGKRIEGEVELLDIDKDSMVIVTPYKEDRKAFYYNQKIIAMPAKGFVKFDGVNYEFKPGESFGLLDWGRGVWTYKNTWYWGAAQGNIQGHKVGWNIGYGFGDTSAASENMLFIDGICHKLSKVSFNIPKVDGKEIYTDPWTFTSDDKRFEMNFVPIIDRASNTDFIILGSDQHQVFGKFNGTIVLDDGSVIEIKDFLGFAEKVFNKW